MTHTSLSRRGALAAATPLRIDYDAFHEAEANAYHPTRNPGGALTLNIAENRLGWARLKERLQAAARSEDIPDWVAGYASTRGAPDFRDAMAHFLSTHLAGCPLDPGLLATSAGATSVIEMTAFVLAEEGDVAVIPAPCYPVYRRDLGNMAGVERYDLRTHREIDEIRRGPLLTLDHLERARRDLEAGGRRFRMLVLTTPDNPTGLIYPQDTLEEVADWCIEQEIHLAVNEIYGLSTLDVSHPALRADYVDPPPFSSFARILEDRRSDYLHLWYAVSKDLGISGLRVGVVYSRNTAFLEAYANLNLTHSVSNHTQWLLSRVLADDDFMTGYVADNRRRLTEAYTVVVEGLRRARIPYVPSRGSLFAWIDLSEFLAGDSEADELALWDDIFRSAGVLLTPGVGFGHGKRGLFRMVYPCVAPDALAVAMDRLEEYCARRRAAP